MLRPGSDWWEGVPPSAGTSFMPAVAAAASDWVVVVVGLGVDGDAGRGAGGAAVAVTQGHRRGCSTAARPEGGQACRDHDENEMLDARMGPPVLVLLDSERRPNGFRHAPALAPPDYFQKSAPEIATRTITE